MTRDVLVGIDAGTSVIKSVAFTRNGDQIASASLPNTYVTLPDAGVEQDMARTWTDTAKTLVLLAEKVPDLKERIIALAVTGQGDGTWLVDAEGEPAAPAWLWLDARGASIAEEYMASAGFPSHYERTGSGVNACQQSIHLVWLKRHAPGVVKRAASAHHCKDWLYFKLTGQRVTDPSEANFTFGQYRTRQYAPKILDDLGAGDLKRLLPPIVDGTETSHPLTADAAKLTGLEIGTPVNLGYLDVICTGLGGGLFDRDGRAGCTILGSTGMHMRLALSPETVKLNSERSGYTMSFPVPGMYGQMQSNMAATLNIDWLLDVAVDICKAQGIEKSRRDILSGLDDAVLAAAPGRLLYHPYVSFAGERGPFLEPAARAGFTGIDTSTRFADLMRGVFEGLCHAARDCYAAMGSIPAEVRLTGGAARSRALRLFLSSALNADVRTVTREEAGAAGAAMMAAVQHGLYPDMSACAAAWVDPLIDAPTRPDKAIVEMFNKTFPLYVEARKALRPIWRGHHALRQEALHVA